MFTQLIVILCSVGAIHGFFGLEKFFSSNNVETTLKNEPTTFLSTTAYKDETAILNCSKRKRPEITFFRKNEKMPDASYQKEGQLYIPHVRHSDGGIYMCLYKKKKKVVVKKFFLTVVDKSFTTSYPFTTRNNEPLISEKKTFTDCSNDTLHNGVCRGPSDLFECYDGTKVNRSMRCNRKKDCADGSDEINCEFWPPKITELPTSLNELYCATSDDDQVDMLQLECAFVGLPEPLIKWKKYEGHVPSKCQQISMNGRGVLLCPNFRQSDQGAYSCVAENSVGSSESQPKSIAKCKNFISCNGFRVKNEEEIEHCLECYCSGKTDKCQNIKSKLSTSTIQFPDTQIELRVKNDGEIIEIPSGNSIMFDADSQLVKYCELSNYSLVENSLLKSYGRNMRIPRYAGKVDFLPNAPDLIMQGNGISLFYNSRVISSSSNSVDVRFWPGNWHHLNKTTATREDIMLVLANVDRFLFRYEYTKGNLENWSKDRTIILESSTITDFSTSVSYIEKCNCPEGYMGLSCETCATGYSKKVDKNGFTCNKIQCDHANGYFLSGNDCLKSPCNINGSISLIPESDGKCRCKEGMSGPTCSETVSCENGYFRVEKSDECVKCWCSGVTDQCNSSFLQRTEISSMSLGGYNSSNGRNFWLLPAIFSGNKLRSYGGHIKYALKYAIGISKQEAPLTVELLTVNDVTLSFTHVNVDKSTFEDEKTWVVPLVEHYWKKSDKTPANRSEFLTVLTKLKAVYVESPYHLSSGNVNLTWVRMSDAKEIKEVSQSGELASHVEQCHCPPGYIGLSCESCDEGYYKEKNTSRCVKCDCDYCDPVEGCLSCPIGYYQEKLTAEMKPVCKKCDCNERESKCGIDNNNNTFCLCKPGFSGLKCENLVATSQNSSHLTIKLSPSKLTNNLVGTESSFNCSYDSGEKLKLSFMKIYRDRKDGPFAGVSYPVQTSKNGFEGSMTFKVLLEDDLTDVQCLVHRANGKEVGRVVATIESIGIQPVKITNCYSDYAFVKETKSKDLICQTSGSPKPTTTWYVRNADGSRTKVDSTDGVYSLNAVKLSQNGTMYICEAENSVGDKSVCTITLVVEQNCDVVHIIPKSLTIKEEETINLQCRTTANSSVKWSRADSLLPLLRTYEDNGNLTIINATLTDAGNYSCTAMSSGNKPIVKSVWVNVTEKLVRPTIIISSNDAVIEVGRDFRVNCFAMGKPTPIVSWKKLTSPPLMNVLMMDGDLTIQSAVFENAGIYECEASSIAGKESRHILIEVMDSREAPQLEVSPRALQLIEGEYAQIVCSSVKGNPPPRIQWFKEVQGNFRFYQERNVLEIMNISRYDTGIYQCVGSNEVGQDAAYAEINVLFTPEISVSDTEISVYENEEITIKCSAVGNPVPKIMWVNHLKGNKRHIGDNDVLANLYLHQPEVKITFKASLDLNGMTCIATNDAGEARQHVSIRVWPELIANEEDVQQVPLGSYHELLCSGCSGKLKWEKLNGLLTGDECDIPNGLMIPSVQIQHNATYVCKCSNDPKFMKTFGIIVTGFVPRFTHDPKSYLVLPATLQTTKNALIEMSFKTNRDNGLLIKDENSQLALYIQNKKLVLFLHSEEGKRHHFVSTIDLKHGFWYSVKVDITQTSSKLILYDSKSAILEEKVNHFKSARNDIFLTVLNNFFIGGTKQNGKNIFGHHNLPHIPSFDGCISRMVIDERSYDLIKEGTYSTSVSLCKRCSEETNHCGGKGKCLDAPTQLGFVCVCPDSRNSKPYESDDFCPPACYGANCDSNQDLCAIVNPCNRKELNVCNNKITSLSCSCSLGYEGLTCEKEEHGSFCVKGDGYVKLSSKHLYRPSLMQPEIMEMEFKMEKPSGLLLWRGDAENYVAISVIKRQLHYLNLNQGILLSVLPVKKISLSETHKLSAKRTNDSIILQIDSDIYSDQAKFATNRVTGDIYLGGAPKGLVPENVKNAGLVGCIHAVSFGGQSNINFREHALETVNVNIRQSKFDSITNKLRLNLAYDKTESESDDDDHDYDYNTS